ncbi:glutaredoxin [Limnohabitans sp.]|uniref:glutaredoxin family protein n=1 Tax=Limnohabitans sp. TaxID=1907725 RepID=UPI00286F6F94|nr:glutaredoxin [Limnohabitans sp.]
MKNAIVHDLWSGASEVARHQALPFTPMKPVIRAFFQTLRLVLGPVMLLKERLTQPKGVQRDAAAQVAVDLQCQSLALYQFNTCPFCIKVRQEMRRLSLPIEKRDAQHNAANRDELQQGSGATKVPCLKISQANGQVRWLQDSNAIVVYLRERFEATVN